MRFDSRARGLMLGLLRLRDFDRSVVMHVTGKRREKHRDTSVEVNVGESVGENANQGRHAYKSKISLHEAGLMPKKSIFWAFNGYDEYK